MKQLHLNLNQIKPSIDDIFNTDEIKTLVEENISPFDNEELEKLFFNHQNAQIPFEEDGFIELDEEVTKYINSKYRDDISMHIKLFIEYKFYSCILDKFIFSIDNLLKKFFDLISLEPNIHNWSKENFKNNEPRLYRYLQLIALLQAFELPVDIKSFINGKFLTKTKSIEFKLLLEYRKELGRPLFFMEGVYAIPSINNEMYHIIGEVNNNISKDIKKIDKLLSEFICSDNETVTLEDLMKKYKYPDVNLRELDIENS